MSDETVTVRVARRVRLLREERGWTTPELGRRAGLGRATVFRVENGEREPAASTLEALAKALGVSVNALLADPNDADFGGAVDAILDGLSGDPARAREQVRAMLMAVLRG